MSRTAALSNSAEVLDNIEWVTHIKSTYDLGIHSKRRSAMGRQKPEMERLHRRKAKKYKAKLAKMRSNKAK
jgi:hypothetical protein